MLTRHTHSALTFTLYTLLTHHHNTHTATLSTVLTHDHPPTHTHKHTQRTYILTDHTTSAEQQAEGGDGPGGEINRG